MSAIVIIVSPTPLSGILFALGVVDIAGEGMKT